MTDYRTCLEAADWRLERLEERLESASAISTSHDLNAERKRLGAFADYCLLAQTFDT